MGIDLGNCSEEELWRFVASHLERRGIPVVLVGGAVVSIYSGGAYRSGDLDLVRLEYFAESPEAAMAEIGFGREGRHFRHPACAHLLVDLLAGPLGIGRDGRIVPEELAEGDVRIKLLSPTDCVRDRMASYIHFGARECIDQAALVARAQSVDWPRIERWCRGEGPRGPEGYSELRGAVERPG